MTERKRIPISLPDDFGTDDTRRDLRTASVIAAVLLLTFAVAAALISGAFA